MSDLGPETLSTEEPNIAGQFGDSGIFEYLLEQDAEDISEEEEDDTENGVVIENGLGKLVISGDCFSTEQADSLIQATADPSNTDVEWESVSSQMIKISCAFFAQEILRGPPEPPYNDQFLIGAHHIEWDMAIINHRRICFLAARDHGKCSTGEERILRSDGTLVKLREWEGGELIAWDETNRKYAVSYAPKARDNGTKPVLKIKTKSGRELTLTHEHPLLCPGGWRHAKYLSVGDMIAVSNGIPDLSSVKVEDAWTLGTRTGSGSKFCYKTVPSEIFKSNNVSIWEFLSGFFSTHGAITKSGITFISVSHSLLKEAQHLLCRVGIFSSLHECEKRFAEEKDAWLLSVDSNSLLEFRAKIERRESKTTKTDCVPLAWDEVISIADEGEKPTWALYVEKYHTYIADEIVNHNSYFVDFAYPIWKIVNNPRKSGFIFSSTQDQAELILSKIKEEIETNPKLQWLIPEVKEKWGSRHIRCSNGHKIYARGFGTKVRGAHPDWIVVDDGLTDETKYSEIVRQKQKDYFKSAITNMIVPTGQIIVIGTPLHNDDLYSDLKKNSQYFYKEFPSESNPGKPDNQALWPERYSLEYLAERKEEIGTIMYTQEFLCSPISDEMSLFPSSLFMGTDVECFNLTLGMPYEFWADAGISIFIGVDFAMSGNVGADYTVIWVMGLDDYGNRWLIDFHREKGLPYQQQLSLINSYGRRYQPGLILLEDNQMQRIFGDELIRTSDLPIKKFTTGIQKNSLDKGVPSLRVLLENKKFKIPRGDKESVEKTDIWIDEMRSFTWAEGKLQSISGHDDTVMACWLCDQAIKLGGFKFSFGEENVSKAKEPDQIMKGLSGNVIKKKAEEEQGPPKEQKKEEPEERIPNLWY